MILPQYTPNSSIHVRTYTDDNDNYGEPLALPDWPAFCSWLTDRLTLTAPNKDALPALGPYRLRQGTKRAGENVETISLIALDIDKGLASVDPLVESLRAYGVAAIVHTSPSDPKPTSRAVRVYVLPSRPILPSESARVRKAMAAVLDLNLDRQTVDPSRIFYVGNTGTPREVWTTDGQPIDVDQILEAEPEESSGVHHVAAPMPEDVELTDELAAQCERAAEVCEPHYVDGQKNAMAGAIGAYGRNRPLPPVAVRYIVSLLPSSDPAARIEAALWAYRPGTLHPAGASKLREIAPGLVEELDAIFPKVHGYRTREERAAGDTARDGVSVSERDAIARASAAPDTGAREERRSDLGNAQRLVRLHGADLRYCAGRGVWLVWDGTRWADDDTGEVLRRAKQSAASLWEEILSLPEDRREAASKWAVQCQNLGRVTAAVKLAESEPGVPVRVTELDADPWLLNVQNGTLDLRTGELRAPDRALLMTKCCSTRYEPDARSDLWDAFVTRTFGGDAELAAYVQRVLGYALFGAWREKAFWFGYGPPDGAKSTFIGVAGRVLGDYHVSADPETWMVRHNVGGNRGDLTRLLGARLVTSLEVRPGLRFDAALMKKVTGGDPIVAAAKYEGDIAFPPTFGLWFGANDRPIIPDDDDGFWNRVRCVPFTSIVPAAEQDKALAEKLSGPDHAPAVLAWLAAGCLAWQRDGVGSCAAVEAATKSYRADMNRAAGFFAECVERTDDPADVVPRKVMRSAYENWARANGVRNPLSADHLGQRLRALGVGDDGDRLRNMKPSTGSQSALSVQFAGRDRVWTGVRLRVE